MSGDVNSFGKVIRHWAKLIDLSPPMSSKLDLRVVLFCGNNWGLLENEIRSPFLYQLVKAKNRD